jgi:mono/diheme cytochrome c family protein
MKRSARTTIATGLLLTALAGGVAGATGDDGQTAATTDNSTRVSRGAYLVRAMGCNDCHTPYKMGANGPEPDMLRQLTGHPAGLTMPAAPRLPAPWVWTGAGTNTAFTGPWGVSFTANLTPDPDTGLGRWTEDMFIATMRTGRHQGKGRPILPPMPYPNVGGLNDEDIRAVFAYLQSLPPVSNRVPAPIDPPEGGR